VAGNTWPLNFAVVFSPLSSQRAQRKDSKITIQSGTQELMKKKKYDFVSLGFYINCLLSFS